jgi:fatty-acyl-CoA synthase
MRGLMQDHPLLVSAILRHAAREHGEVAIVSRQGGDQGGGQGDGRPHRTTYAALEERARRLMGALRDLGIGPGDRVATLAWNGFRHLELYYGIAGLGAVCHTVNPRLPDADIAHILDHAGDVAIFVDPDLLPLLARVLHQCQGGPRTIVALAAASAEPDRVLAYETLLDAATPLEWPDLDERAACGLCYTSGTTGRPRGVLYTHRSTVLHAMAINAADGFAISAADRVLPAVPMFHVNAWGLPFAAPMAGAALALPGRHLDGASLAALIGAAAVTVAAGVPSVWLGLLDHLGDGAAPASLRRLIVGGAACPARLIEGFAVRGVDVVHAWGMTETSPAVTVNAATDPHRPRHKVGRVLFGVALRALDAAGREVARDGATPGQLQCRGHWVAERYVGETASACVDGWLPTGDVGVIDDAGRVELTDRATDLVKSGGEWISSIRLENLALSVPEVAEAAVIAARHPTWGERPLLIVTAKPGRAIDPAALLRVYDGAVPTWWRPDAVLVLDALPHGPTGKVAKAVLRARHADHLAGPAAP